MSLGAARCEILGSYISVLDCDEVAKALIDRANAALGGYVCVSNVHTVVEGYRDFDFRTITNNAVLATADGVPLVWASRWLGTPIHGRASGPDIMMRVFESPQGRSIPHYFVGSTQAVAEALKKRLTIRFPGIHIVGCESGPFYSLDELKRGLGSQESEHMDLIKRIRVSGARLVWVGFGAPKQEYWMAMATQELPQCTLIGVGAAFDFLSGNKARAPLWMQRNGLEWFYRWLMEPHRLTRRYLFTNTIFLGSVALQIIGKRFKWIG